ncbi:type I restriction endonuclease subunit R [Streptomyces aidingensis]|uniref:Type I restriction enzyme, R subunit n=1 Tax=Streptomyces aidingensis TaxID=910347 RepID=A0A1I1MB42_9ACTN|nr:type I restriction endonuclease [Streptomyces aidingensis]SFC82589.1 type I restriction enzyme, R subunit [Streptomyces aidingensis]
MSAGVRARSEGAFEDAVTGALLDTGWRSGQQGDYDPELGLDTAHLWEFIGATQPYVLEALKDLAGGDPDAAMREFKRLVAQEIDARGALDVLRNGVKDRGLRVEMAYFRPAHTVAEDALDNYRRNRLSVTRQLRYSAEHGNTLDLVLFVNGIPVATAELKSSASAHPQTVKDAIRQYRQDRDPKDLLFAKRALVHFAVDEELVFLTTKLKGQKTGFLPFNQGSAGPGNSGGAGNPPLAPGGPAYRTAYLWEEVWQPDAWLDLLKRFLHVEDPKLKKGGQGSPGGRRTSVHDRTLIFPRYHQWHAVRRLTEDAARHGSGNNYLVMHSAGSGKSNTIAWLAHRLSTLHGSAEPGALDEQAVIAGRIEPNKPVFHKIVVITDRSVLDRQLQDTIYQFDHTPGVVERITGSGGSKSQEVAKALANTATKIVIVTVQTFPYVLEGVQSLSDKRIAVIVDEAHSGQSGDSVSKLRKVLRGLGAEDKDGDDEDFLTSSAAARQMHPNLTYFAFTATPKQKTLNLFGIHDPVADEMRAFHIYSMKQAIEEGFILDPLRNYTTYTTQWKVQKEGAEQIEVDPDKAKAELGRFVYLNPATLAQHAEVIVDHFQRHGRSRLGGRAKAMVVTRSREHAVRMYRAVQQATKDLGCEDLGVLVAFSGELELDDERVTEAQLNGIPEKELPEAFAYTRADDRHAALRTGRPGGAPSRTEYRILIVAEKYQTGFDQPLLTSMYVEKPLTDVAAVQTLSRINRTHPLKSQDDLFVLDFANKADAIQDSFRPYFTEARTQRADPNLLYAAQRAVMNHQLLREEELKAFIEAYVRAQPATDAGAADSAAGNRAWERQHAALYRHTDAAKARFEQLQQQGRDAAEDFRTDLRDYLRKYGFLSQLMPRPDTELERLYLYGKHLANILPPPPYDPSVDIGELDLTHMRVSQDGKHDLSLDEDDAQALPGFDSSAGTYKEPSKALLSEIIEDFNERHGLGLSEADRLMYEERIVAAAEDPGLEAAAVASRNEGDFELPFQSRFRDIMIERAEADTKFTERYFSDAEFQGKLDQEARRAAYRLIRRRHNLPDTN